MSNLVQQVKEAAEAAGFKVAEVEDGILSATSEDIGDANIIITFGEDNYVSCDMLLFDKSQLTTVSEKHIEALETMIEASVMLPLSSVGKSNDNYMLNGQLIAVGSDEVIEELNHLCSNYVVILKMVREYLV